MPIFKESKSDNMIDHIKANKKMVIEYLQSLPSITIFSEKYPDLSRSRLRMLIANPDSFYSLSVSNMMNLCSYIETIKHNKK